VEANRVGAYVAGALLYVILLYAPSPLNLALAPIIAGIAIAVLERSGWWSFLIGLAVGVTGLLMVGGAGTLLSLRIMRDAGGPMVPLLVVLYHALTPAFLATGFTLFRK
jgi:hypothetical protein